MFSRFARLIFTYILIWYIWTAKFHYVSMIIESYLILSFVSLSDIYNCIGARA